MQVCIVHHRKQININKRMKMVFIKCDGYNVWNL